ncbi:unnamed protein product [Ilex paraguariensis]|uniref:Cytochrome P450 n=1 Tax=Ilex paraguariensis TaxID=185542 RepID=A0ABC8UQE3_9AQUA
MTSTMVESSTILVNSWIHRIQSEGGVADIEIYEDIRRLSGEIISRACFGSNYSKGEEIFSKLRALQALVSDKSLLSAIPGMRCLPTKRNRKIQSLGKEFEKCFSRYVDPDVVGFESRMADSCRAEISEVCGKQLPNAAILPKMKTLTMVINESMRLYPTAPIITREALQEMKFGGLTIPKGVTIWTFLPMLHQDPEIWGPDANKFNPERFANGVTAACKLPQVFMPFGFGPRLCLGMPFALQNSKFC